MSAKWQFNGQYFYDLTTDQAIEWLAGLRYTSDCWYMGFSYSNQLKNWDKTLSGGYSSFEDPIYENNFSVNFGIIGFGTSVGAGSDLLSSSSNSLGYGRPFFLNN